MPITYTLDRERRLLEVRYLGSVTKQEIFDHFLRMEIDPRGVQTYDAVIDFGTEFPALSANDIRELASFVRGRGWPSSRRALVARDPRSYGDARMFEKLAESGPVRYRVFKSTDDAHAWLVGGTPRPSVV